MATIGFNAGIAVAGRALGARLDPYGAFSFLVEIEGIIAGGFSEVSGLDITTEVDSIREGGVNDYVHKLPKWTTQSDLILKKGQTDLDLLWNWYADVVAGKVERKNGSIYLLDAQGVPAMWWDFSDAYPIKWSGPILNATSGQVAFESLTLAHHGLTKSALSQGLSAVRGTISVTGSIGF
ncbi:MAG: phage tail protein [Candidatus Dechloromonas phosphoritropha]